MYIYICAHAYGATNAGARLYPARETAAGVGGGHAHSQEGGHGGQGGPLPGGQCPLPHPHNCRCTMPPPPRAGPFPQTKSGALGKPKHYGLFEGGSLGSMSPPTMGPSPARGGSGQLMEVIETTLNLPLCGLKSLTPHQQDLVRQLGL